MGLRSVAVSAMVLTTILGCGAHSSTRGAPSAAKAPALAVTAIDPAPFDAIVRAAWEKQGIAPAAVVDDATFLRRASIDIVGTIPSPALIDSFLRDSSPTKRRDLVRTLVNSNEYALHWMNYWDDVLMGREVRSAVVDRRAFRRWLYDAFTRNTPWNQMVTSLVAARGVNSAGGERAKKAMGPMPLAEEGGQAAPEEVPESVNGAVNYSLRFLDTPLDLAGTSSRVFLGVQIQCAQCHDHKTEKWKQADFQKFASGFLHFRLQPVEKAAKGEITQVEVKDFAQILPRTAKDPEMRPIRAAKPTALDGTDLSADRNVGAALASWITSKDNPWFADAIVNRMWGHYVGRGFTDPVDDMRPSNPPVLPEVLRALSADFVEHGYDLRRLTELICAMRPYQIAPGSASLADQSNRLFAKFRLTPLGPEELLNALFAATNIGTAAKAAGVRNVDQLRLENARAYAFLFDVDEEFDVPDFEGTITQALTMLNGNLSGYGSRSIQGSALRAILDGSGDENAKIDALYLRVLSRHPTAEESQSALTYVGSATRGVKGEGAPRVKDPLNRLAKRGADGSPRTAAYEDLMWAMLNSSEFRFNH